MLNDQKKVLKTYFIASRILFLLVTLPYMAWATLTTTYNNQLTVLQPRLFSFLGDSSLDLSIFWIFYGLLILTSLTTLINKYQILSYITLLTSYIVVTSQYESFWYFSDETFANGASAPFLFFVFELLFIGWDKEGSPLKAQFHYFLKLILPTIFLCAGLEKLIHTGLYWLSPENIGHILTYRYLLTDNVLLYFLLSTPLAIKLIGPLALMFEVCGGLLIIISQKYVAIYGSLVIIFLCFTFFALGIDEFLVFFIPFTSIYFAQKLSFLLSLQRRT